MQKSINSSFGMNERINYFISCWQKMVSVSVAHTTKYMQNSYNDNFEEIWTNRAFSSGANFAFGKMHPVCKK